MYQKRVAPVAKQSWIWKKSDSVFAHTKAHTKSEARSRFKKELGLERLPVGAVIVRVDG